MRVALYGGSFDPPHLAHQMACLYALSTAPIDQVWMVPCFHHPFGKISVPFHHRKSMCELAAQLLHPHVLVTNIEEELGGVSYTLRTVQALEREHPRHQFFTLVGEDVLASQHKWYGIEELQERAPFIVIGREGASSGLSFPVKLPKLSSTWIREELRKNRMPNGYLSKQVADYIQSHGLYQKERLE